MNQGDQQQKSALLFEIGPHQEPQTQRLHLRRQHVQIKGLGDEIIPAHVHGHDGRPPGYPRWNRRTPRDIDTRRLQHGSLEIGVAERFFRNLERFPRAAAGLDKKRGGFVGVQAVDVLRLAVVAGDNDGGAVVNAQLLHLLHVLLEQPEIPLGLGQQRAGPVLDVIAVFIHIVAGVAALDMQVHKIVLFRFAGSGMGAEPIAEFVFLRFKGKQLIIHPDGFPESSPV